MHRLARHGLVDCSQDPEGDPVHVRAHLQRPVSLDAQCGPLDPRRRCSARRGADASGPSPPVSSPAASRTRWPCRFSEKVTARSTGCTRSPGMPSSGWPGQPVTAEWTIEDPASVEGSTIDQKTALVTTQRYLKNRIGAFIALPINELDAVALSSRVEAIG